MAETTQITCRIARVDKKILRRAVKEGRAMNESDAIRVAIRMLGENMDFAKKVQAAIT
jgi:Arc/MetJ-type ribon-helix-helix transcriptional regulator